MTEIILVLATVLFGLLSVLLHLVHKQSGQPLAAELSLAAAQAQRGDFESLEDLLRASTALSCKKPRLLIWGSFDSPTVKIGFAAHAFSSKKASTSTNQDSAAAMRFSQLCTSPCCRNWRSEGFR